MTDPEKFAENLNAVPYGAQGLGIGEEYPVEEYGRYDGSNASSALWHEAWGGEPMIGPDGNELYCFVLRDEGGEIVAKWDEGRWWTPRETEAFMATMKSPAIRMMAEATEQFRGLNRKQRRRRLKGD